MLPEFVALGDASAPLHFVNIDHHAQKSVDRLGKAIEAAEEEMEGALRRTTDVHRSQLRQKELELSELQRVMQAKERSIDSLRDTLSTTKRTYETRLSQTESALSIREAEVGTYVYTAKHAWDVWIAQHAHTFAHVDESGTPVRGWIDVAHTSIQDRACNACSCS